VVIGGAIALVMWASRLEAQEPERVEIRCRDGWCAVPEKQLMLILRARLCGVAT
jgi:hypothetical protein